MTMLTRLEFESAGPSLAYRVCTCVRTRTLGGYTHTDRLSTQACWRQDKFAKLRPKRVKKCEIGPKALWHKAKADVEPPS